MELISDSSVNYVTEETPHARRRLASFALSLAEESYVKAAPVETRNSTLEYVESGLKQKIIGQDRAIYKLVSALECAALRNPNRPIGSFMFLGPTGVGKSETAKELARLLHGGEDDAFLKIDCAEFSQGEDISALLGAPPKYVGREQDPLLDPEIIEQNNSVILFDEIEKAHPDLHNLLLQILEEGEVTLLNGGEVVSFRSSIIIMTSNVGSDEMMKISSGNQIGFKPASHEKSASQNNNLDNVAYKALKAKFKPEFINRIDHRITFNQLNDEQLSEVLDVYVFDLTQTPELTRRNIGLTLAAEVNKAIVSQSPHRDELGARPVLRTFEQTVWHNYVRNVTGGSIPANSWALAFLADEATNDSSIPVEFYYKELESAPAPVEEQPEEVLEHQQITVSQTIKAS